MLPVTLLIAVTGIVFGPVAGAAYAIVGALLSASATYGLGRWLGRDVVHRMLGPRVNRLSRRIAKRGIVAVAIVRLLPIAPFTVVNVVAGASHLSFRDYLLGTLLGMSPGILITVTFVHNLAEAIRNPSLETILILAGIVILLIGFAIFLQRLFAGKKQREAG
jgi:phospholipase D1/2